MMSPFNIPSHTVHLFLCILIALLISFNKTKATPTFRDNQCPNTCSYTSKSTYESNLNKVFSSLSSDANNPNNNGFDYSKAGNTAPDIANGIYLCCGDLSNDDCQDCVATATKEAVQRCPNQKTAIIWYDECMLYYSNQTFTFSNVDQSVREIFYNTQTMTDTNHFKEVLEVVMNDIATRASSSESGKKFATRQANLSPFQRMYSLAQCTPDLSVSTCNTCLRDAISNLPICCDGRQGAIVWFPSCYVSYELYQFYQLTTTAPPPSSPGKPHLLSLVWIE
ncbi:hypothetical protein ACSBR2_016007 [Camellia fascicularis]